MNALVPTSYNNARDLQANSALAPSDREYHSIEGAGHLVGRTCLYVTRQEDKIAMIFDDASFAVMHHNQDCCETVTIEDLNGDLNDLLGVPILVAEEREQDDPKAGESATWTFYCLRTLKGSIDIRWYGESNGYYSETASIDIREPVEPFSAHEKIEFSNMVRAKFAAQGL